MLAACPRATAFEIFGFKIFGSSEDEDADIADPLRYSVTLSAPDADEALTDTLNDASSLVADAERPVSGSLGLISKARSDRERLVAALYAEARYEGVVTISIDGQPIDDLPPDATFTGPQPVPVTIEIAPGPVFTLGDIALRGDAAGLLPEEFGLMRGGDAGSNVVLTAEARIVRKLKEGGRPLATVTDRDVVADHDSVDARRDADGRRRAGRRLRRDNRARAPRRSTATSPPTWPDCRAAGPIRRRTSTTRASGCRGSPCSTA